MKFAFSRRRNVEKPPSHHFQLCFYCSVFVIYIRLNDRLCCALGCSKVQHNVKRFCFTFQTPIDLLKNNFSGGLYISFQFLTLNELFLVLSLGCLQLQWRKRNFIFWQSRVTSHVNFCNIIKHLLKSKATTKNTFKCYLIKWHCENKKT